MNDLYGYLWVLYLGAAAWLALSRKGNLAILIGLAGLGLESLSIMALSLGLGSELGLEQFTELLPVVVGVSVLLLLAGVLLLAARSGATGADAAGGALDASGTNLSTLLIPRNETNTHMRAEKLRDEAAERLQAQATDAGIETIVQKSNAHSPEVWLRIDYLIKESDPHLSLRASVDLTVQRFDFHRFEHLFKIVARVGTAESRHQGVIAIDADAARRIQRFITTPGAWLRLPNKVRESPWALWRPHNKVARIRPDWVFILGVAIGVLLFFAPLIGPLVGAALFVALYLRGRLRRTYVLTSGRPMTDPRLLQWMDSWQATVADLAAGSTVLTQRTMDRLGQGAPRELAVGTERIGYWSVDGRVERDQIVVRHRRALGFVHVVPYGETLYVGWECHLNAGSWAEETLARGVDRETGRNVHANRVVFGVQRLNEYDLADANFLSEWLHEAVKRELRLLAKERAIDLEVDFTVQRESRKDALAADEVKPSPSAPSRGSRFRRVT